MFSITSSFSGALRNLSNAMSSWPCCWKARPEHAVGFRARDVGHLLAALGDEVALGGEQRVPDDQQRRRQHELDPQPRARHEAEVRGEERHEANPR